MAPKGGTCCLLLIMLFATVDGMAEKNDDYKDAAKKLMMKCKNKGYPMPPVMLMKHVFNNSDVPMEDRNTDQSNTLISTFLNVLNSVTESRTKDSNSQLPMDAPDMTNNMWNCSNLPAMIKLMRNSSESSTCYMKAFMAPHCWAMFTGQSENGFDSNDYDTLLWAAKPMLQDMPAQRMNLPPKVVGQNVKKMMTALQEVYDPMSEGQKSQVVNWVKEQISQNYHNCTMKPSSDSTSRSMERCKPSLKWLDDEALEMMGPYLSGLEPADVDSSPREKLCKFFNSTRMKSVMSRTTSMNPSLSKKFLQRIQECFSGQEFPEHADKLGPLVCYYYNAPDLTPELSKKLLSQLDDCDNPTATKLKKHLINSVMSASSSAEALRDLGSSVTLLSSEQLSAVSDTKLKEVLKYVGTNIQWKKSQLRTLVKKLLGDKKCKVSGAELMALQSVAEGLPKCVFKHVKAHEILNNTGALKNISRRIRKWQSVALLQGLGEDLNTSELVRKLPDALLCRVSLSSLDRANITSLDQVENKTWSLPQAAYLAKKMHDLKMLDYRRLRSILRGLTCKMIDNVADSSVLDMAQALSESPQWLSKVQAGCAAQKLFATLEKERADYFKTITEQELNMIPTFLLIHLPPSKVKDLPDSVCPAFLDKMEMANLTLLSVRSLSRPALTQRALLCLANGRDLSELTTEDVSRLGPLLCELPPSQLRLIAPDVLNSSLRAMASCQHIPQSHRANLIQLVKETLGNPSDWPAETVETMCPLLLLDDEAISSLPNKPWMKDVYYFVTSRSAHTSAALNKKFFNITTTSIAARKKREASDNSSGNGNNSGTTDMEPTQEQIEELGMKNVYWTAAQLDVMSKDTFVATVEILGAIPDYSADQLAVLSKKATEAFGPVSEMTESDVMKLGCITRGFANSDLQKLPFSLDSLEDIAHCGWNEPQMEPAWEAISEYNNLTAKELGAAEMVALNQFICGLSPSEIQELNIDAFREAVGLMDGIQCSIQTAQLLKVLAVSAFGVPSTWTEAEVSDLDNIIAGLNATELASMNAPVFSFLSKTCIPLIPPQIFAALSAAQLEALGPDNTAMVTDKQRAALNKDQLAALEKAATGSRGQNSAESPSPPESGAPSLRLEGITDFMKPLLLLLMGFLLL